MSKETELGLAIARYVERIQKSRLYRELEEKEAWDELYRILMEKTDREEESDVKS